MPEKKTFSPDFGVVLHVLLLVVLVVNIVLTMQLLKPASGSGFEELRITFIKTPDCDNCFALEPFEQYFTDNGVSKEQMESVGHNTFRGKLLTGEYDITKVPTIIIQGDVQSYDFMQGMIDNIATRRKDAYVVTKVQPPYYHLETEEVKGEFALTYLDDSQCEQCYDVNLHDDVFDRMGMTPASTKTVDINTQEGQNLVDKYAITSVPTIIMQGELEEYPGFSQRWGQVGSVEENNTYVLRSGVQSMGSYKKLPEGDIIEPKEPEAPSANTSP